MAQAATSRDAEANASTEVVFRTYDRSIGPTGAVWNGWTTSTITSTLPRKARPSPAVRSTTPCLRYGQNAAMAASVRKPTS